MNQPLIRSSAVRWAAPLITLLAAIIAGTLFGVQLVVLTLAAAALLLVIWLLWSSVQALAGESELTFEEAFSFGARSAEEEQKRAVLRALKDLEYERSVGKISEEDYQEYSLRYRAEAKRLIQSLDENLSEGRKLVEQELARRLAKQQAEVDAEVDANDEASADEAGSDEAGSDEAGSDEPAPPSSEQLSSAAPVASPAEASPTATRECAACQTRNELDARFCKACGKTLVEEVAS